MNIGQNVRHLRIYFKLRNLKYISRDVPEREAGNSLKQTPSVSQVLCLKARTRLAKQKLWEILLPL